MNNAATVLEKSNQTLTFSDRAHLSGTELDTNPLVRFTRVCLDAVPDCWCQVDGETMAALKGGVLGHSQEKLIAGVCALSTDSSDAFARDLVQLEGRQS